MLGPFPQCKVNAVSLGFCEGIDGEGGGGKRLFKCNKPVLPLKGWIREKNVDTIDCVGMRCVLFCLFVCFRSLSDFFSC